MPGVLPGSFVIGTITVAFFRTLLTKFSAVIFKSNI